MKLYVYNSQSWLFIAHNFESIDWYKNNFKEILEIYEENKHSSYETNVIKILQGNLKYNIYGDGSVKIRKSSIITTTLADIIEKHKLETV